MLKGPVVHRHSLLELYSDSPTSRSFLSLIRKDSVINEIVKKVPSANQLILSGNQLVIQNPNIRPKTSAEVLLSQALLRVGVSVMFEPVHFNLTRTGLRYNPDIWTNIYLRERDLNRMVMIETHGFERLRGKNMRGDAANRKYAERKEQATVNKMCVMHQERPDIYFILYSDMNQAKFQSEFGIADISKVCDEYRYTPNTFDRQDNQVKNEVRMKELKGEMKRIRRMPNARLQKDKRIWHSHVGDIIREELIKALQ